MSPPLLTLLTKTAVRLTLSASVSFPRTPGADTLRVASSSTLYESFNAVGGSFTGVIVIDTVAVPVNSPSVRLYVKLSDVVSLPS